MKEDYQVGTYWQKSFPDHIWLLDTIESDGYGGKKYWLQLVDFKVYQGYAIGRRFGLELEQMQDWIQTSYTKKDKK